MKKNKSSKSEAKNAVRTAHIAIDSPKIREVVKDVFQTKIDFEIKHEEVKILVLKKSIAILGNRKRDFRWEGLKEIIMPNERTRQVVRSALEIKIDFENLFEETRVILLKDAMIIVGANNHGAMERKIQELLQEEQI